ncbi:WD40/YVTN/BNR-like repeat-containing protein [Acanthopleuribacter pedis]|uniref:Glycosyl hydrolase n=1 Tax=Acanthopleuribacter pedis TaxID=442870 RepID=A0A8J7Q812_9BACT|nr:hypothetical protein [Acanthopleuribacter pedis]MBO1320116.1 hypothetical protein [Acanthopleuribacter pedis]
MNQRIWFLFVLAFGLLGCLAWQNYGTEIPQIAQQLEDQTRTERGQGMPRADRADRKPLLERRREAVAARAAWEYDLLKNPATGKIPADAETLRAQVLRAFPRAKNAEKRIESVISRGPGNLGGRTRAIVFDRADASAQTLLAGGVSSGVFRTTNRGQTWTKVSPQDQMHNVTALAQDPNQTNVWYYGTGEISGNSASFEGAFYWGNGIWRSTDGGLSWSQIEATAPGTPEQFDNFFDLVSRLVVHPRTSDLYISTFGGIFRLNNSDGSIERVIVGADAFQSSEAMFDIEISADGSVLYAALGGAVGSEGGIYRSTTGDAGSWEKIAGEGAASPVGFPANADFGRTEIALDPVNTAFLLVLMDNFHENDCESREAKPEGFLWRYDTAAGTWTDLSANLPNDGDCLAGNNPLAVQGGYNLTLEISPADSNQVFVGGTNLWVSRDGFSTASTTSRLGGYADNNSYALYPNHHPDIHVVVFDPNNPDQILCGSDGGVHEGSVSRNPFAWTNLNNNYLTYQYYHVALAPNAGDSRAIGGAQDNGTTLTLSGTSHTEIFEGDGAAVAIGQNIGDQEFYYVAAQNGTFFRTDSRAVYDDIRPAAAEESIFVTYFFLDQDNTENLYYAARNRLFRTNAASTVTPDAWGEFSALGTTIGEAEIRSLAASRGTYSAASKLYVGSSDGRIFRIDDPVNSDGSVSPVNITPAAAQGGVVSSIAVDPNDDRIVLATIANFEVPSVFLTMDASVANPTWMQIEGNIGVLSFRAGAIARDAQGPLYLVGTNAGLWSTRSPLADGTTWQREETATIGSAVVSQLVLRPADNNLLIGTHGNGMYQATLASGNSGRVISSLANRYHLPDVRTNGTDATTWVGLVNWGDSTSAVEIFAFNDEGEPLGQSQVLTSLGAKASRFVSVSDLFSADATQIAWLQVGSAQALSIFAENRTGTTRAAYQGTQAESQVLLPHIAKDLTNFETVLNVVNGTDTAAGAELTEFPGETTLAVTETENAYGFSSRPITDYLGTDLAAGPDLWGRITATAPRIAGMEYFTRLPNRTQQAALGLNNESGTTLNFLHVATDTGQFWTGMLYINVGENETTALETYYDAGGNILRESERLLAPNSKATLFFDFANQEVVPAGTAWVQVTSDAPLIGYELFGAPSISDNDYFTGLQGNYQGGRGWVYPYFNSSASEFTGLVAVNLGEANASVTFRAYDTAGNLLETQAVDNLAAKTKFVTTLSGLFQSSETLSRGAWIEAQADGSEFAGFLLWGDQGGGSRAFLSGITATPIP